MTFAEKEARRKHEREVAEHFLPGVNPLLEDLMSQIESAADVLYAARDRMNGEIAGSLIYRIETGSKLFDIPEPQLPAMIEDAGAAYVEQLVHLAEQRIARIRAAIKGAA